jgi:hypothetical protein
MECDGMSYKTAKGWNGGTAAKGRKLGMKMECILFKKKISKYF